MTLKTLNHSPAVLLVVAAACIGMNAGRGSAQQAVPGSRAQPTFRAAVDLHLVTVAVLDGTGMPVRDLGLGDFAIWEDGVRRPIDVVLTPATAPMEVALLVDTSGSVADEAERVRALGKELVAKLNAADCIMPVPFASDVARGEWGTPEENEVTSAFVGRRFEGNTRLNDAVVAAIGGLLWRGSGGRRGGGSVGHGAELHGAIANDGCVLAGRRNSSRAREAASTGLSPEGRRRAIVVISDGIDEGSVLSRSAAVMMAWEAGIPIFSVPVGVANEAWWHERAGALTARTRLPQPGRDRLVSGVGRGEEQGYLESLARVSGGAVVGADEAAREIVPRLAGSYTLGYRAHGNESPGRAKVRWRDIEVRVNKPEFRVVVQDGYYGPRAPRARAWERLAVARESLGEGDVHAAVEDLDEVIGYAPELWEAHYYRGMVLGHLGTLAEARSALRRTIELKPGFAAAHGLLAQIAARLGDVDASLEHAILASQGGEDMDEHISLLVGSMGARRAREALTEYERGLAAPRVYVHQSQLTRLPAILAVGSVLRSLRSRISDESGMALTLIADDADFELKVRIGKEPAPDAPEFSATLYARAKGERYTARRSMEVPDIENEVAVREAVDEAVMWLVGWVKEEQPSADSW